VFLATETALGRRVVVKVLSPDVGAGVSDDRFRREIQVAASLQHPHIVPLLTAGRAGEFLYYTMPYVEGESLRAALAREGELPVADSVRILTEVARALHYAHRQGIVHRDIKPDNILLAEGEAQVTDFGIAKALSASTEGGTLTGIGLTLGTPAYMAPEQAVADPTADHRVDLYALGVVGYEMLAGQPPFSGRSPQQLLAAHATEDAVPVERRRPAVPPALAQLIGQLLAKRAADRPRTAGEVLSALGAVATPHSVPTVQVHRPEAAQRGRWLVAGGLAAIVLAVCVAWLVRQRPAKLDRSTIAIAPFRVSGADSSLGYLREGMVDLLAAKLSGTVDLRPADPRTILSKWARAAGDRGDLSEADAMRVAAGSGAGRLVEGEVVGGGRRLTLSARILGLPAGTVQARATAEGPTDSLTALVDRLAASLLALGAGEAEQRLAGLTSTSLPALRAYLDGESLLRRGAFPQSAARFADAVQLDSTFALAGLGYARAAEWFGNADAPPSQAAWRDRERLSPRDRAYLEVYLGPRYPAPAGMRDQVEAAERFVAMAPDSPDAWYKLADNLFHFGPLAGIPEAERRAAAAFDRSLALDSSYAPTIQHLSEMAAMLGDTAGVRRGRDLFRRVDSTSKIAVARRWHVGAFLGDTVEIRAALASDSMLVDGPYYVLFYSLDTPLDLRGTDSLFPRALAHAVTKDERRRLQWIWNRYELVRGRPGRAPAIPDNPGRAAIQVTDWLFGDGDSALAAAAARTLVVEIGTPPAARDIRDARHMPAVADRYAAGQYALSEGREDLVRRAVADLRSAHVDADSAWQADQARFCALILEAQLATAGHSTSAVPLLGQLDSALGNPVNVPLASYGNLVAARLHERAGDIPGALAAVRRRLIGISFYPTYVRYHAEEGRLAALAGDRQGAILAYRRYLSVRTDPEPRLRPQADRVRAELNTLLQGSTDR